MVVIKPPRVSSVKASTGLLLLVLVVSSMALVGAAANGFTTTQTADSGTVAPGNNVTLTVTLDNVSSEANAAGVDVGLPENWSIVSSMDSELGNPSETQVVFSENRTEFALIINSTTNTSFDVSYTVSVPSSASEQQYSIAANGSYFNSTQNTTIWDNTTTKITVSAPPALSGSLETPLDSDKDGKYEDVNGDGDVDVGDVQALFANRGNSIVQNYTDAFDFNGDGDVDVGDVQALFAKGVEV
jgi:hypothetical protein